MGGKSQFKLQLKRSKFTDWGQPFLGNNFQTITRFINFETLLSLFNYNITISQTKLIQLFKNAISVGHTKLHRFHITRQ